MPPEKETSPLLEMADIETEILCAIEAGKRGILSPGETEHILGRLKDRLWKIEEKIVLSARIDGRGNNEIVRGIVVSARRRWEQKYGLPEASTEQIDWALALPEHLGSKEIH